jgi:hypothetical protein
MLAAAAEQEHQQQQQDEEEEEEGGEGGRGGLQRGKLYKDEVLVLDCEWGSCDETFSKVS